MLFNNAGVCLPDLPIADQFAQTDRVNYTAILDVCDTFQPLMAANGVIVNVASQLGMSGWRNLNKMKQAELRKISSVAGLSTFVQNVDHAAKTGNLEKEYGHMSAYDFSKLAVIRLSEIQATIYPQTVVSVCPGWCQTDLGHIYGNAPLTPAQGAEGLVWLGLGGQLPSEKKQPDSVETGGFYQSRKRTHFYNR
eukprot:Trichotokara_eunicae@DN6248_c0_g1_i3.p1